MTTTMTTDEALRALWRRFPEQIATLDIVPPEKGGPKFIVAVDAGDAVLQGRGTTLAEAIARMLTEPEDCG